MNNPRLTDPSIELRSYAPISRSHQHDYGQWVFPLQGILELDIGCLGGVIDAQHAAFIHPTTLHSFASKELNTFLVLDIPVVNQSLANDNLPSFWNLPDNFQQFLQFAKAHLFTENNSAHSILLIKDCLLSLLTQHFLANHDKRVFAAIKWIEAHYQDPINITQLARQCCLSSSQLQRRFKVAMGLGIAEYWKSIRLKQAQKLLRIPLYSVESIALQVGFTNVTSFCRSFLQAFQQTPTQWRKMQL